MTNDIYQGIILYTAEIHTVINHASYVVVSGKISRIHARNRQLHCSGVRIQLELLELIVINLTNLTLRPFYSRYLNL